MSKFTPGPWRVDTRYHVHAIVDANGQDLGYQDVSPQPEGGNITSRGRTAEETAANAQLIAAAPDLLEALQEAKSLIESYGPALGESDAAHRERMTRAKICAAIARATGN